MADVPVRWLAKAVLQRAISLAPNKHELNHRVQRLTGRWRIGPDDVVNRASMVRRHLEVLRSLDGGDPNSTASLPAGTSALELGTGWHPVVPVLLHLAGLDRIVTVDYVDHLSPDSVAYTIGVVVDCLDRDDLGAELPSLDPRRVERLRALRDTAASHSLNELCLRLGIERAVGDITAMEPTEPVDVVVSNHVLEHVPEDLLAPILGACYDLCRPGGAMSHVADLIDHGHYVDSRLSQFNYLRFSDTQWRIVGNDVQYENRLRIGDYRDAYAAAGVPIDHEELRHSDPEEILRIPLAKRYRSLSLEDLTVQYAWFVSRRPVGAATNAGASKREGNLRVVDGERS